MAYCIMTAIFGIPITEELYEVVNGDRNHEACTCSPESRSEVCVFHSSDDPDDFDPEEKLQALGFECFYGGGDNLPGFCGVELCEFDECTDAIDVNALSLTVTPEQQKTAMEKIDKLPQPIRELCKPVGTYLIPSSS